MRKEIEINIFFTKRNGTITGFRDRFAMYASQPSLNVYIVNIVMELYHMFK